MSNRTASIWGDIILLLVLHVLFVLSVVALRWAGVLRPMSLMDWAIVIGALISLALSTLFSSIASGGHAYHRLGYELCGLSLGTCLSLFVAKSMAGSAALPHLGHGLGLRLSASQQIGAVALAAFLSVFGLTLTALIVRTVDGPAPVRWRAALSLISFLVGVSLLLIYVAMLVGAGA